LTILAGSNNPEGVSLVYLATISSFGRRRRKTV
jgi:hypothetical protein